MVTVKPPDRGHSKGGKPPYKGQSLGTFLYTSCRKWPSKRGYQGQSDLSKTYPLLGGSIVIWPHIWECWPHGKVCRCDVKTSNCTCTRNVHEWLWKVIHGSMRYIVYKDSYREYATTILFKIMLTTPSTTYPRSWRWQRKFWCFWSFQKSFACMCDSYSKFCWMTVSGQASLVFESVNHRLYS